MRQTPLLTLLWGIVMLAGACSSSEPAAVEERMSRSEVADVKKFEDFDASPYADEPPAEKVLVVHNVPESIMNSTAGKEARAVRTVQGFRIQIHASLDKSPAVEKEEFAKEWWRSLPQEDRPASLFGGELPTYLRYVEPYYRVRVGNFERRDEAERALEFLRLMFPNAFIAIDTVTIVR